MYQAEITTAWFGETPETHGTPTWRGARDYVFECARFHRAEGAHVTVSRDRDNVHAHIWDGQSLTMTVKARRF